MHALALNSAFTFPPSLSQISKVWSTIMPTERAPTPFLPERGALTYPCTGLILSGAATCNTQSHRSAMKDITQWVSAHGIAAFISLQIRLSLGALTYLDERVPVEQAVVLVAHLEERGLLQGPGNHFQSSKQKECEMRATDRAEAEHRSCWLDCRLQGLGHTSRKA